MCAEVRALADVDRSRWAALAERALVPNPFFHPDFVVPAARIKNHDAVGLLVVGDWEAALPVRAARRWRRLPLPGTLAWLHDQCFLGTPLVAPERPAESFAALLRKLPSSGLFGELDIAALDAFGAAAVPRGSVRFGAYTRAAVERRPEATYLDGRLSGKHRRAQRRAARDLGAELGDELELVDRAGDADAVDAFLALEDAGWKGEQGTSLARVPDGAQFVHEVCAAFAARGALQLLFLQGGGRVVAARLNFRAGAEIFCFKIAFDESLRRYSPGFQMELRMLEHFHADPTAERMDSCAGPGSEMFDRLWPDRKALGGLLVPRTRAVRPALRAVAAQISKRRSA